MKVDLMVAYITSLIDVYIDWLKVKIEEEENSQNFLDGPEWAESEDKQEELLERLHNFQQLQLRIEERHSAAYDIAQSSYHLRHLWAFAKPNTPCNANNEPEVEIMYEPGAYKTLGYWAAERLLP